MEEEWLCVHLPLRQCTGNICRVYKDDGRKSTKIGRVHGAETEKSNCCVG